MSMLNNAISGIRAANTALNVTGQNVSNATVEGYSRQRVNLGTASGSLNGVEIKQIDRVVNGYLNNDIWRTSSDANYHEGIQTYLGYIEEILGSDSLNIDKSVSGLSVALNAAMSAPENQAYRQQLLSSGKGLEQTISQINDALQGQFKTINRELNSLVSQANATLSSIAKLNQKIERAQNLNQPTAELKDSLESLIKDLSGQMSVDVSVQSNGMVNLSTSGGVPLVQGLRASTLNTHNGELSFNLKGQTFPLNGEVGGRIGGLFHAKSDVLIPAKAELDTLVKNIADAVNQAHSEGFDLNGNAGKPLFSYDPSDVLATFKLNDISPDELAYRGRVAKPDGGWQPTGGKGDSGNIQNMLNAIKNNSKGFDTLVGQIAIQSKQNQTTIKTANAMRDSAIDARDSVSAVNLDEEAANLMYFQQQYDANARVIRTASELFNTLINSF